MTQSMSVEYDELMARADLLDQPMPKLPQVVPQPPCPFVFVEATAGRLDWNAAEMRRCLEDGEREWKNLATSLRNAAKAYETVDEASAAALGSASVDGSGGSPAAGSVCAASVTAAPRETAGISSAESAGAAGPAEGDYPYYEVREAAYIIIDGDQGTSYKAFAYEWQAFERALLQEMDRFDPFQSWNGVAQEAVEANFAQQRNWIYSMASLCVDLAKQALQVVEAHEKAVVYEKWGTYDEEAGISHTVPAEHPTTYEVSQTDFWYAEYTRRNDAQGVATTVEWYEEMQLQSETSLKLYVSNGRMPIPPLRPSYAPNAYPISEPQPKPTPGESEDPDLSDRPGDGINIPGGNYPGWNDGAGDYPTDGSQTDGSLTDGSLTNGSLSDAGLSSSGMAGMGGMPSSQGNSDLTDAAKRNAPGGVKPAAAMGGGGAGGGGMPKMPLADAPGAEGAAGGAGAAGGRAGIGGAVPGVGGRGGMAGGGMPMGGGAGAGQGKDVKQGKRVSSEEEALYTEDREWTGGVIGRRKSKGVGDD